MDLSYSICGFFHKSQRSYFLLLVTLSDPDIYRDEGHFLLLTFHFLPQLVLFGPQP